MMSRSKSICGSDEVMAMLSPGAYYRGKWQDINITGVGENEDTPLDVRKSLVGLTIPTVFSKEQLESQGANFPMPDNSRCAYAIDVICALLYAENHNEARQLLDIAPNYLDKYVIEQGIYELA